MRATRYLIVNADDFGRSAGVNRGICESHKHGIVTSASLMVRWPAAAAAARYARAQPNLSVGLHFDLAEWVYHDSEWVAAYQVVPPDDRAALAGELSRQLARFYALMDSEPTHLDSHQHVHMDEPLLSVMRDAAQRLSVPLRRCATTVRYCGDFYGQADDGAPFPEGISVEGLSRIISGLPPGVSELSCHPGDGDDLDSVYRDERATEMRVLCDPRVCAAIESNRIELISFRELLGGLWQSSSIAKRVYKANEN